ncbi:GNAT family N-acetyltransferase [Algoriphagus boritolerans]|uniref:N-acetylglutamate synthase, GNAT family n=1 Tax=Algoriphagus boritolerans DSM 17298 = JCM 18970 TaxID=1120964 RepID=A0A1H5Z3U1_9BACT|nr:GNAT family N-acetyltransferase [Algoriphagus boritolerans]SEG31183.1 N-acetylglutamate synthase, GNAT family [Algoriphagus boritolerans DSM 17298 = JCM 18970]
MNYQIREASPDELLWLHERIPEFPGKASLEFYTERLNDRVYLALIAEKDGELLGFKVGYQDPSPDTFYSWMGGVRPEFRKVGVAAALAEYQETWAMEKGFKRIYFKTRNRFPAMISLGLKRGFKIIQVIRKGGVEDYRVVMRKEL